MNPRRAIVFGCLCLLASGIPAQEETGFPDLLQRLTDLDWLWSAPAPNEECVQFSSFDRRSREGPDDGDAWYANHDRGQFLRTERRDGKVEHVMVDTGGPGCVVRIWSANPGGKLFFYLDGDAEPTWEVDFQALTSGTMAPLLEPLAGVRSRGANCHLPIPFAEKLKITASADDFYYQVNVRRLPAGRTVESFRPAFLEQYATEIEACRTTLAAAAAVPDGAAVTERRGSARRSGVLASVPVPAGGVVRGLDARVVPAGGDEADPADRYRQVLVVVRCGDEELVKVPIADFFGAAPDLKPYRGYALGVRGDRTGYCRFPMPMPEAGSVSLVAEGDAFPLDYELRVAVEEGAAPDSSCLRFRADWHLRKGIPTRPFSDFLVLDASGTGRFCGCALMVRNPVKGWWGEGDEKFWVDGEEFPSTFGTGTEDYFGYAWCCPDPFQSAWHAQPQCDGPGNYGFTAVNRIHALDSVPFTESFRFDLEVWHWTGDIEMDYASVAYWYGAPGSDAGLPPMPPPEERGVRRLPVYEIYRVPGAIEGEKLRVVEASGGRHLVQQMAFGDGKWSGEAQLWWIDGAVGDRLSVAVPVPETARYRVFAGFTKANDYGIVQVRVGDRALGDPVDLYNPTVVPSGSVELGTVELEAGETIFALEVVGKNEQALPRRMVGLDYLRLERLE